MLDSILLAKIPRLVCDEPFAAQRRREPSAQELCPQLVIMIEDETAILSITSLPRTLQKQYQSTLLTLARRGSSLFSVEWVE
jgi:hypothetical protein